MARRYASYSVENFRSYVESNLPTHIDTIETDESITLTDPAAYLKGVHPGDERYPRCEFEFDTGTWFGDDARNRMVADVVNWHLITAFADADILGGQEALRRYQAAMMLLLRENSTLGGAFVHALALDWGISGEESTRGGFVGVVTISTQLVFEETAP